MTRKGACLRKHTGSMTVYVAASAFVVSSVGLAVFFGILGGGAYQELQNATDAGALAVAQVAPKVPFVRVEDVQDGNHYFQGYGDVYQLHQYGNDGPDYPTKNKINLSNINRLVAVTQYAYANSECIAYDLLPNTHPIQYPLLQNRLERSPALPDSAIFHYPMLPNEEGPRILRAMHRMHNALYEKVLHGTELKDEFKRVFFANSLRMWRGLGPGLPKITVDIKPLYYPGKVFRVRRAAFPYSSTFSRTGFKAGRGPVDPTALGAPDFHQEEIEGYEEIGETQMMGTPFGDDHAHLISAADAKKFSKEPPVVQTKTGLPNLHALPNAFQIDCTLHTQQGDVTVHSYAICGGPKTNDGKPPWMVQPDGAIGVVNSPGYNQWKDQGFGMSQFPGGIQVPANPKPVAPSLQGTQRMFRRELRVVDARNVVENLWPNERRPEPSGYEAPGEVQSARNLFIQIHQDAQAQGKGHASQEGCTLAQRRRQMWSYALQFAPETVPFEIDSALNQYSRMEPGMLFYIQNNGQDNHLKADIKPPEGYLGPLPQDIEHGVEIYQCMAAPGKHGSFTTDSLVYAGKLTEKMPETGDDSVTCTDAITYGLLTGARHRPNMWVSMGSEGTQTYDLTKKK